MVRKGWSVMELLSDGWVTSGKGDSDEDGARESSWTKATQATGHAGQSQKSRSRIVVLGPEENAGRNKFRKRYDAPRRVVSLSVPTQTPSRPRQSPRWHDSRELWTRSAVWVDPRSMPSRKHSRRLQEVARERPIAEFVKEFKDFIERSTRRVTKLKAELESETGLLEEGRARLARWEAQQAAPVGEPVAGSGARTSTLQQMVNQWQVERDSLSQELRRSRAPKARPWSVDGPPDFSVIRTMPDHFHNLQEWLNTRNRELRDSLEFRSPDVIAHLSHLLPQGASQWAAIRQGAGAQDPNAMDVHGGPGTRMSALIDAAGFKRRCLDGWHWCRVEFWWMMKTNYKLW